MKEQAAYKVLEHTGEPLVTHDDRLLIRAQKHEIKLEQGWRYRTEIKHSEGEPVIVNMVTTDKEGEVKSISTAQYEELEEEEKAYYRPQFLRGLRLAEGVTVVLLNNQLDLRISSLMQDWRSRYRMALEYMVTLTKREVIKYRPIAGPDERNMVEAIRNRLKRYGRPTEYEHDILIRGELGRQIARELEEHAVHTEGSTYYLQGYVRHKDTRLAVKWYDIGKRDGEEEGRYFKIETTLLKKYFRDNNITVSALTEQPDIQGLMLEDLVKVYAKVFRKLSWRVLKMLAQELGFEIGDRRKAPEQIARAVLQTERTLTDRVETLERQMKEHERRLRRLEKEER